MAIHLQWTPWMFQSLRFWCPESSLEEWHWQTLLFPIDLKILLEVKKHFDVHSLIKRKELEEGCTTKIKEEHILKLFNILKSKASLPPQSHQIGHTSYKSPAAKITNMRYRWDTCKVGPHVNMRYACGKKIGYASRTYKGDQVGQLGQISYWYDVCTVQVWHTTRFDLIPGTTYRVLKYLLNSSMIPHSGSDGHLWPLGQTWIGNKLPNHMLARVKKQSSPIIGIELWKYFHKNHYFVKIFP